MGLVTAPSSSQPIPCLFVLASVCRRIRRRVGSPGYACSLASAAGLTPAILVAVLLCLWPSLGQSATGEDAVRQAAQSVLSNDAYQRDLPFSSGKETESSPTYRFRLPEGVGALAEVLLWTILAAVAALVVFWLIRELPDHWRRRGEESTAAGAPLVDDNMTVGAAATTLDEADRLAEQGAYAEAMHLLLLHTLDVMRRQLDVDFRQSQTSREILARREVSSDARTPLSFIVSAVELTYFGGRSAGERDYRDCRLNFERFTAIGNGAA